MAVRPKDSSAFALDYSLTRNFFVQEFHEKGSTIRNHERYALHVRKILVDEGNYLGLFALDALLKNKEEQYRKCGITPKANHPILAFFQIQALHEHDKENSDHKYLPDRPDLDKILALLHDEGEEVEGFTKENLNKKLHDFIDNLRNYIHSHNRQYPNMNLAFPSNLAVQTMRDDIAEITDVFDLLTRNYKGQPKILSYYEYHDRMIENARACRIKCIDKACNAATFVYRSSELLSPTRSATAMTKYREWVQNQINKMRDIYFDQPFSQSDKFNNSAHDISSGGFVSAVSKLHPASQRFFDLFGQIMKTQLLTYTNNVANEEKGHRSPIIDSTVPEYDLIAFTPRINLISVLKERLEEVKRLDAMLPTRPANIGMFDIPFPQASSRLHATLISQIALPLPQ